ncbi:hypothetical protein COY06_00775 [Candidatus Peregrinibacteria bacterium CG_4_10_14_0_2_um_filter_41_8]|nr:MAG: hypothetical protein COY06_00775 [Candidatus Peregrinibacteria bacterium CG_4_10_14_0_2_um_filter_41_8]
MFPKKLKIVAATMLVTATILAGCTGEKIDNPAALTDADIMKGNPAAQTVLMEYADFQCPACAAYSGLVKQVEQEYGDKINIVYRNFPLTQIHANALSSAKAAEAANHQGKFWEMHDRLYIKQQDWSSEANVQDIFLGYAEDLGLNKDQFLVDYDSADVEAKVKRDIRTGNLLGVGGTPTFFVNGELIPNPHGLEEFKAVLDAKIQAADDEDAN